MLKGINPLLNADVLHVLRAMGHGDDLIIADTNFPSDSVARQTVYGRLLRIDASAADVVQAVLSVMPIDTFVNDAAARMEVVDEPKTILPVMTEVQDRVTAVDGPNPMLPIERFKGKLLMIYLHQNAILPWFSKIMPCTLIKRFIKIFQLD